MMIAYYSADIACELKEYTVMTLIIENQKVFSDIVSDINNQLEGYSGEFVLSEDFSPLDMRKHAELVTGFIPFELNRKELLNKIYSSLKAKAVDANYYQKTQELTAYISKYLFELTTDEEQGLIAEIPEDIGSILKAFNVKIDDDKLTLAEKILEYMTTVNRYKGERVFFLVNLRSYLTDKQAEELFESVVLKKIKLVCIENKEYKRLRYENAIIIDEDMCVI